MHARRHALGQVLYRNGLLHICHLVEKCLPVMRLGNTISNSTPLPQLWIERVFINNAWFHEDTALHLNYCFSYKTVQEDLIGHIARKAALQRMFVHYHHASIVRFAGYVMDAFYKAGSNTRFHIMQIFEERLCATYGYEPFWYYRTAIRNVQPRIDAIMPTFVPCKCHTKHELAALPCRCGVAQVPY